MSTQSIKQEPIHSSLSKNTHVQLGCVTSFGVSQAPLDVQAMGRGHGHLVTGFHAGCPSVSVKVLVVVWGVEGDKCVILRPSR